MARGLTAASVALLVLVSLVASVSKFTQLLLSEKKRVFSIHLALLYADRLQLVNNLCCSVGEAGVLP